MARSDDPRDEPRRGTPAVPRRDSAGRGGLSDARRYTPRGRTVREAAAERASGRSDPFRPALQVLSGGRAEPDPQRRRADPPTKAAGAGSAGTRATGAKATGTRATGANPTGTRSTGQQRTGGKAVPTRASGGRAGAGARTGDAPSRRGAGRPAQQQRRGTARPKVNRSLAPPRPGRPQRRLRVATVMVLAMFVVIAGRLVVLQFTDAEAYAANGLRERITLEKIAASRGAILDRDGKILAHSVEARYVYADPTVITDVEATADALAPLLGRYGIARSEIVPKLRPQTLRNGTKVQFVYLARGVDVEVGDAVKQLNKAGIYVARDERREVPGHDLAASVLGFTGRDRNGLAGLEEAYEETLRGVDGERVYERGQGKLNREIPGGLHHTKAARPGSSVQLTIDRHVQFEVQQILADSLKEVKGSIGAAVVLDVKTGEVVAQASYPGYDAADPLADNAQRLDTSSGLVVDPGSTHKAIVIGAALQEGVVNPDTKVLVGPSVVKGDRTFVDSHRNDKEVMMSLGGILAYSSNIGTIRIADRLGKDKLYEYQRRFGLGEPTGVGLKGEVAGEVRPPRLWSGTSHGTIPIGNGVAVTPLQMAAVYAAIANDGTWVQPHLVRGTLAPGGRFTAAPAAKTRQVLDPKHAAELRLLLEAPVVVKGGTGTQAAVAGHRVAGKTGTGARVVEGKYADGYVASFIGMAPADAPRFVVAVFAHAPDASGASMAPAFSKIMSFTLGRFTVPPTMTAAPTFTVYP